MIKKIFAILFLAVLLSQGLMSQPDNTYKVYSLQEVLRISLKNNYDLRINNANVEYSKADLKNAFGQYLPGISLSSGYQRQLTNSNDIPTDLLNSYNMRLGANLTLFDGFGREANYSRAQKNLESSNLSLEQMLQTVYLDAYNEYINVVRSHQIVRIRRENLELGKAELERINAKYEAGVLPVTAVYSQEADLGNKEIDLISSENDYNTAKARLLTIMGLSPDMNVEFNVADIPATLDMNEVHSYREEVGSFPNAVAKALDNRMDYKAAKLRYEASQYSLEISKSNYYPVLTANSFWSWNNNNLEGFDKSNIYFGLSLNVPIFSNFAVDAQVQSGKLALEQKNVELLKVEQNIRASVQIAYLNLQAAEKQVEISEKTVFSAQENYKSTQERLQVGAATINDLIQANTQLITAQINQISSVYSYVRAKNDLKYSMGNLAE